MQNIPIPGRAWQVVSAAGAVEVRADAEGVAGTGSSTVESISSRVTCTSAQKSNECERN